MIIYHYSKELFTEIKSLKSQNEAICKETKQYDKNMFGLKYCESISFFIDQLDLKEMPKLFNDDHPFYYTGNEVYEYQVDVGQFKDMKFIYLLSEFPEKMEMFFDNTITDDEYSELEKKILHEKKYYSDNYNDFEKTIREFKGKQLYYFKRMLEHKKGRAFRKMFAPFIPHLITFPSTGVIQYKTVNKVKFL